MLAEIRTVCSRETPSSVKVHLLEEENIVRNLKNLTGVKQIQQENNNHMKKLQQVASAPACDDSSVLHSSL